MITVELVRDAVTSPTNRNNRRSRLGQLYTLLGHREDDVMQRRQIRYLSHLLHQKINALPDPTSSDNSYGLNTLNNRE